MSFKGFRFRLKPLSDLIHNQNKSIIKNDKVTYPSLRFFVNKEGVLTNTNIYILPIPSKVYKFNKTMRCLK